ncbi:FkbM family methyltransferase [Flavobacterium maritimum]|uniref:FkbM family methyltransferase n=1 Tax=Flavobacterium maritimum TaxID=3149042 RepID=UPI0032B3BA76
MLSKKNIKNILIKLKLWDLLKKIAKKDIGQPLNKNLFDEGIQFYSQFIEKDDLVFDVGANFGNRVEIFLGLGAKVIAIEPQEKCVKYLTKKYRNKIIIENIGLGSKNEIKQFFEADNSVLSTFSDSYINKVKDTRHKTSIWKKSKLIQVKTMVELVNLYGEPKFIKIDVEGFELEVFSGFGQKSGIISFEYNVPELHNELVACVKKLKDLGYDSFTYSIGESMKMESKWLDSNQLLEIISSNSFLKSGFGDIYAK